MKHRHKQPRMTFDHAATTSMASKSRAFIVQEPLHMVNGAAVPRIGYHTITPYGNIQFLFTWSEIKNDSSFADTERYLVRMYDTMHDFSDSDYLVPLGNPALTAMAVLVASEVNQGRVKLLDWIRDERRYRVVQIDLGQLDAVLDEAEASAGRIA